MERINGWEQYGENQMIRETLDGVEIIEAVWLDTCPHDANKEYCVVNAEVEYNDEITDFESATENFYENCMNDNFVVFGECSKEEALDFIREYCKKTLRKTHKATENGLESDGKIELLQDVIKLIRTSLEGKII